MVGRRPVELTAQGLSYERLTKGQIFDFFIGVGFAIGFFEDARQQGLSVYVMEYLGVQRPFP